MSLHLFALISGYEDAVDIFMYVYTCKKVSLLILEQISPFILFFKGNFVRAEISLTGNISKFKKNSICLYATDFRFCDAKTKNDARMRNANAL